MSKYLLVLGAPDGAGNAAFQPLADAFAKGEGTAVPFVVWSNSQLASVKNPAELVAAFGTPLVYGKDQLLLYVVAGDDTKPSMGQTAMDLLLTSEYSPLVSGVMYAYDRTTGAMALPATTINITKVSPPPAWAFKEAADKYPNRLRMTFIEVANTPAGTVTEGPANGMLFAGAGTSAVRVSAADVMGGRLGTIYGLAERMAKALRGNSAGPTGPAIEPPPGPGQPAAKPAAKQASLFTSPLVIGALGVGAYLLFFRKKRGHKGSSRRS